MTESYTHTCTEMHLSMLMQLILRKSLILYLRFTTNCGVTGGYEWDFFFFFFLVRQNEPKFPLT